MSGVASQNSGSLAADEVFQLPPYADEILISVGESLAVVKSSASSGGTLYTATLTTIEADKLYTPSTTVLPFIQCDKACTIHYRVSKR